MATHDLLYVALRAAALIAVLHSAGVALFQWLFGAQLRACAHRVMRLGRTGTFIAIVLVLAQQLLEPARLAGGLEGVLEGSLHWLSWTLPGGRSSAVRLVGLVVLAFAFTTAKTRAGVWAFVAGTVLVIVSFSLTGHTMGLDPRLPFAAVLIVHLFVIAFWFGALLPLRAITYAEASTRAAEIVRRFSHIATRAVPVIFVAGLLLALVLLPDVAALQSAYGAALLAKVAGFAVLLSLASVNKWRLVPALAKGDADAARTLRTTITVEWLLIAAVLVATAVMTTFFSP